MRMAAVKDRQLADGVGHGLVGTGHLQGAEIISGAVSESKIKSNVNTGNSNPARLRFREGSPKLSYLSSS